MTCKCISYNQPQPGQADDEVLLTPPDWVQSERGAIPVDACIAPVVQALWDAGVWTRGSCCGHGDPEKRSVLVDKSDRLRAEQALREIDPTIRVGAWELVWSDATDASMQTLADLGQACDAGDVERVAEAIWVQGYGRHRKNVKWPADVIGGSQELFRGYARAALSAMSPANAGDVRRKALEGARRIADREFYRFEPDPQDPDDEWERGYETGAETIMEALDLLISTPSTPTVEAQPVPTVREAAGVLLGSSEFSDALGREFVSTSDQDGVLAILRALSAREDRE